MPRLHLLYLPHGERFAFILDQTNPMSDLAEGAWHVFAEKCGADDILITADTIDIDPELDEPFEPVDGPVDYFAANQHDPDCGGQHIPLPDLLSMVQAAHAAAWVPWEPANLDPESPKVVTHREEVCPSLNDGMTGCPMHDPILEGGWVTWPYFASSQGIITRICDHGITHPTPEEYLGGFDTPHLCDGCPCAPVADFSIVVSDLANTKLPRGTLLLGTKDDPRQAASRIAPEWADRLAMQPRDESGKFIDNPTPVTAPPSGEEARGACGNQLRRSLGFPLECSLPLGHDGAHSGGGKGWDNTGAWPFYPGYQSAPAEGLTPVRVLDLKPCDGYAHLLPCALGLGHRSFHRGLVGGSLVSAFADPIPAPDGEGPIAFVAEDMASDWVAKQDAYVGCGVRYNTGIGSLGCKMPHGHEGNHTGGGVSWLNDGPDSADRTPAEWYPAPAVPDLAAENWGTARIQPLGPDGEPVGEAKDYPLAGPVEVTEKEYGALTEGAGGETVNCFCGLPIDGHPDHGSEPDAMPTITANVHRVTDIAKEIEPVEKWVTAEIAFTDIRPCGAGVLGAPCVLAKGHEGLHEFGQFNRV